MMGRRKASSAGTPNVGNDGVGLPVRERITSPPGRPADRGAERDGGPTARGVRGRVVGPVAERDRFENTGPVGRMQASPGADAGEDDGAGGGAGA
jgi:hypothetical protein